MQNHGIQDLHQYQDWDPLQWTHDPTVLSVCLHSSQTFDVRQPETLVIMFHNFIFSCAVCAEFGRTTGLFLDSVIHAKQQMANMQKLHVKVQIWEGFWNQFFLFPEYYSNQRFGHKWRHRHSQRRRGWHISWGWLIVRTLVLTWLIANGWHLWGKSKGLIALETTGAPILLRHLRHFKGSEVTTLQHVRKNILVSRHLEFLTGCVFSCPPQPGGH